MTDQLTDEYLEKRAARLADDYARDVLKGNGWPGVTDKAKGFEFATLDALKVHRDGLRVLEKHRNHIQEHLGRMVSGLDSARRMTAEIDQVDNHIASLRELLGVSQ